MKKILFLLAMLPMMWACSSSSNDIPEEPKEEIIDIVGVWSNGDYFVSFSSDGYYTSYIDSKFIDSGDYILDTKNKSVECTNYYFERTTNILVLKNEDELTCSFKSVNVLGENITKTITFCKTNEYPQGNNNTLVGKVYEGLYAGYGDCEWEFVSNYAAKFSTIEPKSKTKNIFYIYRAPYLYTQYFKPKGAGLNAFYSNCDKGDVCDYRVDIKNGEIKFIDSIK